MTLEQQINISNQALALKSELVKIGVGLKAQEQCIFNKATKEQRGLSNTEYKAYKKLLHQQSFINEMLGDLDDINIELF